MTLQTRISHANYYGDGHLVNNPQPLEGQREPLCVFEKVANEDIRDHELMYSIGLAIHNQENIIEDIIISIIANTIGKYELIIILDACTDKTQEAINRALMNIYEIRLSNNLLNLAKITIVNQPTPIFETSCDNLAATIARGKYYINVQADCKIHTFGWNWILSKPCIAWSDVFAVSGRAAHDLFAPQSGVGKLGMDNSEPLKATFDHFDTFYSYETCIRTPLLFDLEKLRELGYMDEQNFCMDGDDHDLMARAALKGWKCGYVPIEYESQLMWGSTRKGMDSANQAVFDARMARSNGGYLGTLPKDRVLPEPELRKIPFIAWK